MEYSGLSTFFVILAIVMHEATVYQNLTQLSIRKSRVDFLLSELTQLLEICHVEITSLRVERQHADCVDIMLTVNPSFDLLAKVIAPEFTMAQGVKE